MRGIAKRKTVEYDKLTLSIPADIKQMVREKAAAEGRNITDIILDAFDKYLNGDDKQEQLDALSERVAKLEKKTKNL